MFGLRLRRKKDDKDRPKAEPKLKMAHHERIRLYVLVTVVLVGLAGVSLALSVHGSSAIRSCGGILLSIPKNNCYTALANYTKNASICGKVSGTASQAGCIISVAQQSDNLSVCSQLANYSSYYMSLCVSGASTKQSSVASCTQLAEPYSSQCAFSIAAEQNFSDNSTCSYVSNLSQRYVCSSMYYYARALADRSPSYCSLLPNAANQGIMGAISQQNSDNYTLQIQQIQLAELNVTPQNYCYYRLASITSDYSLCTGAPGLLGQLCTYGQESSSSNATSINASSCSSAPQAIRGICTYAVLISTAVSTMNVSICSQISNTTYQSSCITAYAIRYNSTYCSRIGNLTYRQGCYASASGNATSNSSYRV
ncbi:MAG: hypothetical protein KGH66_01820 [Candidatus Micrarchaeota archaeon]|nr:hypothetical protein [Candidatus Micrarchaeota archaeon]